MHHRQTSNDCLGVACTLREVAAADEAQRQCQGDEGFRLWVGVSPVAVMLGDGCGFVGPGWV